MELIEAYIERDYKSCLESVHKVPDYFKTSSQYSLLKTLCMMKMKTESIEVHSTIDGILKSQPNNEFAHNVKGLIYFNEGNLIESIIHFNKALTHNDSAEMNPVRMMKYRAEQMLRATMNIDEDENESQEEGKAEKEVQRKVCKQTTFKIKFRKRNKKVKKFKKLFDFDESADNENCTPNIELKPTKPHVFKLTTKPAAKKFRKRFQCNFCFKNFYKKFNVDRHKINIHGMTENEIKNEEFESKD